jgi:ribosomal protein S7
MENNNCCCGTDSEWARFAQTQEGLVNINVGENTVQVPIGIAAQVCPDVAANVLAQAVNTQTAVCTIDQQTAAEHNIRGQQGGGAGAQQEGLVNVNVEGNTVQVPIGVAAQVCPDVAANVLAQAVNTQTAVCTINQQTAAEHNIRGQQGGGQGQAQGQGQSQEQGLMPSQGQGQSQDQGQGQSQQ